jgi:hypothetical protein
MMFFVGGIFLTESSEVRVNIRDQRITYSLIWSAVGNEVNVVAMYSCIPQKWKRA